jgi:hypothetical protein
VLLPAIQWHVKIPMLVCVMNRDCSRDEKNGNTLGITRLGCFRFMTDLQPTIPHGLRSYCGCSHRSPKTLASGKREGTE